MVDYKIIRIYYQIKFHTNMKSPSNELSSAENLQELAVKMQENLVTL